MRNIDMPCFVHCHCAITVMPLINVVYRPNQTNRFYNGNWVTMKRPEVL